MYLFEKLMKIFIEDEENDDIIHAKLIVSLTLDTMNYSYELSGVVLGWGT